MGRSAICVQINVTLAVSDCKFNTPTSKELAACVTAQNVRDLPIPDAAPDADGIFSYKGSNIMMPAPWLRDTIINAETNDPFELIWIVIAAAQAYDTAHPDADEDNKASVHTDDFSSWAWGVGLNRVPETRLEVNADDGELESYRADRHLNCISGFTTGTLPATNGDNAEVLRQLTGSIACQTEESATSNQLQKEEIIRKKEIDDDKKDRTKKYIHASIIKMLKNASATNKTDLDPDLTDECKKFLNATSQGHAEQELSHQFETLKMTDVTFAPGTIQSLFLGEFTYGNSSLPSNSTVFAFYEQPPLSGVKQTNYLTCHLIHEHGIKQSIDEIKASLKQEVIVPKDFNELGTQLQYFVGAVEIFFGAESRLQIELNKLLHFVGKHKKHFCDVTALDEWFPARFLFAIDRRVQLVLANCKPKDNPYYVNDRYLDFTDITESILFGNFWMPLPPPSKR